MHKLKVSFRLADWTLLLAFLLPGTIVAESVYTLGRAPQLSASVTSRDWTPFVEYLSTKSGVTIRLKVYNRRSDFEHDLKAGVLDFYYGNPAYATIGKIRHRYIPLIRSNRKQLQGILVSRKDSPVRSLPDLNGKTIAFPSETAFAASLYLRGQLEQHEHLQFKPAFIGSHDNVYRAVLIGKYPAGGGVGRTLEREPQAVRDQLRVIYTTPGLAPHPLVAHPRVPPAVRTSVTQAVLDLSNNPQGNEMLKKLKLQQPIIVDYQRDYAGLEKIAQQAYQGLLH